MESIDGIERGINHVEKYDNERVTSNGKPTSRFGNGASLTNFDASRRGKERIRRSGYHDDENKSYTQGLVRHRNHDEFSDLNINTPDYGNFLGEQRRFGSFPYYDVGPSSYETSSHYEHSERMRFRDRGLYGFATIETLEHDRVQLLRKLDDWKYQLNHDEHSERAGFRDRGLYGFASIETLEHDRVELLRKLDELKDQLDHYEHGERTGSRDQGLYGFARIETLEHDQVEFLRKLDELKDQLNQSWDMDSRPSERMVSPIPPDSYGQPHNSYAQEGLKSSYGIDNISLSANYLESPHLSHIDGYNPHTSRFVSGTRDSYSPRDFPHEFGGFRPSRQSPSRIMHQPYHEDVHGYYSDTNVGFRPSRQSPSRIMQQPYHEDVHGYYSDTNPDHMLRQPGHFLHHLNPIPYVSQGYSSGGSTLHMRRSPALNSADLDYESETFDSHQHRKVDVAHRRGRLCHPILGGAPFITCCNCFELLKLPRKHMSLAKKRKMKCGSCFSVILFELGSKGYVVSVSSRGDPLSKDVDVGSNKANISVCPKKCEVTDKSNYDRPQRQLDPLFASSTISVNKHNMHRSEKTNFDEPEKQLQPLSADSSILVNKHNITNKSNSNDPEKLIDPTNKSNYEGFGKQLDSLSSTSSSSVNQHYVETDHRSSDESKKQVDLLSALSTVSVGNHDTDTEKKSNYGDSEKQVDTQFAIPSISTDEHIIDTDKKYDDKSEKQLDTHFATPSISMHKHITDDMLNSDKPEKQLDPLSAADATSEKHYNLPEESHVHCSGDNISSQFDDGDESKRSDLALDQAAPSQISAMATENGVQVNTFSDRHISHYSGEIREEDHPQVNIKGEPFIGVTEESSHDFSDYDQSLEFNECEVFVNGHFIPNRDIKKAEKQAGPIQPGEYWYDIQAGFWGVMGCPCLGIIMPNIQEFNYPLPKNCAAGNTGVLANGRELHQKDLDILAGRGLPILKYGSYIIEISGKVVDVHTGKELDSLGKLAPTVEREKRGFGMRVP